MNFLPAALGVAFAAFCICLIVRIINRHEKSRLMIWTTLLATAALLSYPLSFGPACRLVEEDVMPYRRLHHAYRRHCRRTLQARRNTPHVW